MSVPARAMGQEPQVAEGAAQSAAGQNPFGIDVGWEGFFRTAEFAKRLASALCSRRTWEMENSNERASLRQIQWRE